MLGFRVKMWIRGCLYYCSDAAGSNPGCQDPKKFLNIFMANQLCMAINFTNSTISSNAAMVLTSLDSQHSSEEVYLLRHTLPGNGVARSLLTEK